MPKPEPKPVYELAWLAFIAKQEGWDSLAQQIANDVRKTLKKEPNNPENEVGPEPDKGKKKAA